MRDGLSFTLLGTTENPKVEKLRRIYKESPQKARVVYFSDKKNYETKRFVIFEDVNGDFTITEFEKTIGISVTNRIYSSEKKLKSLIYKNGLFWLSSIGGNRTTKFVQVTFGGFQEFFNCWGYHLTIGEMKTNNLILEKKQELMSRFSWLRFIEETPCLQHTAFNTFIRNKLYSRNAAFKFLFKAPLPTILTLVEASQNSGQYKDLIKVWREMKKVLVNVENLKLELLRSHYFMDTCRMAMNLGRKINCSWGVNRLKAEHDAWAKEITNVLFETMDTIDLRIKQPYLDFAARYGHRMLKTNKELFYEGMVQRHCVATYVNDVNNGYSGIYHIEGYTLELRWGNTRKIIIDGMPIQKEYEMRFGQFRGYKNESAGSALMNMIRNQLIEFNASLTKEETVKYDLRDDFESKAIRGDGVAECCGDVADRVQHQADWLQLELFVGPYGDEPPLEDIEYEVMANEGQAQEIATLTAV